MSDLTQIFGEETPPKSRARHARESAARAGLVGGTTRENVRKFKRIKDSGDTELEAMVRAGTMSLDAAYRLAIGEERRPLYVQLPLWLDDLLTEDAEGYGKSRPEMLLAILSSHYEDDRGEG